MPLDMLFARGNAGAVREVVVAGRTIVQGGQVTGLDLGAIEAELRGLYRVSVPRFQAFERAWRPFERGVEAWFRAGGCC